MPGPSSNAVLVRHVSGAEKYVDRSRLGSLSGRWEVVEEPRSTKRSAKKAGDSHPAVEPDNDSQEG